MPNANNYDLKSVNLPRLSGLPLKLFTALIENRLTRTLLLPKLLADGGIVSLRRLQIDEPPTMLPHAAVDGPLAEAAIPPADLAELVPAMPQSRQGFQFATVRDYAAAYRSGQANPVAVAENVLAAIQAADDGPKPLRAIIAHNRDDLLTQAQASAQRWQAGQPLSIFDGVPVAVKDQVDQVPYATTIGTNFLGRQPARQDSTVVARMRAAGALLIGKANMHEIGIGTTGLNNHHGTPRNPYHPDHHTGGSSSGSAAAVAAGLCPAAIAADGGGSIRIPAGLCGLVGLKATFSGRLEPGPPRPHRRHRRRCRPDLCSSGRSRPARPAIGPPTAADPARYGQARSERLDLGHLPALVRTRFAGYGFRLPSHAGGAARDGGHPTRSNHSRIGRATGGS